MNFISCEVDSEGRSLKGTDFKLPISQGLLERLSVNSGDQLVMGIRPPALGVEKTPSNGNPRGKVFSVEPRGDSAVALIDVGPHRLLSESSENLELEEDMVVGLEFPESQVHLFEAETEARLATDA